MSKNTTFILYKYYSISDVLTLPQFCVAVFWQQTSIVAPDVQLERRHPGLRIVGRKQNAGFAVKSSHGCGYKRHGINFIDNAVVIYRLC